MLAGFFQLITFLRLISSFHWNMVGRTGVMAEKYERRHDSDQNPSDWQNFEEIEFVTEGVYPRLNLPSERRLTFSRHLRSNGGRPLQALHQEPTQPRTNIIQNIEIDIDEALGRSSAHHQRRSNEEIYQQMEPNQPIIDIQIPRGWYDVLDLMGNFTEIVEDDEDSDMEVEPEDASCKPSTF